MSDQELDNLFKDASGKLDTPFDASDWQKMETLLDAKGTVQPSFWNWKKYTWVTVFFITSVALVELWSVNQYDDQRTAHASIVDEKAISTSEDDSTDASVEMVAGQAKTKVDEKNTSVSVKQQYAVQQKEMRDKHVTNEREKSPIEKREQDDQKYSKRFTSTSKPQDLRSNDAEIKKVINNEEVSAQLNGKNQADNPQRISLEEVSQHSSAKEDSSDLPIVNHVVSSDSTKEELPKENKSLENNRSFSLKLVLSPDFSSVGYFTPGKTGFNYGLMAEYAFGKHISVSAGGIWSKKLYTYKNIENYSYGQVQDGKTIDGDCRILDVPLNVNYYFNPGHRFTVYASVGLSSYIMFKESYNYDVVKNGYSYDYTTQVKRKNNEWFKMSNLSIGLQYQLKKQWALQIEPFVKAPLSGIGEGHYKLVSSGIFTNIKYTFK